MEIRHRLVESSKVQVESQGIYEYKHIEIQEIEAREAIVVNGLERQERLLNARRQSKSV